MDFENAKLLNLKQIRLHIYKYCLSHNYFLDPLLIEYNQEFYSKSNFKNINYSIKNNDELFYYPITIDKNTNKLNFYGSSIRYYGKPNLSKKFNKESLNFLTSLSEKFKIDEVNLQLEINDKNFQELQSRNKGEFDEIFEEAVLDLSLSESNIFNDFSKGHKHDIKKKTDLDYQIIDSANYKKDFILNMMNLHQEVSGRRTRSLNSWLINEKMILNKQGFLIVVKLKNKIISSSFFFNDKITGIYFSSCTLREYFKIYSISHNTIWLAIKYLKKKKCKFFFIGRTKTFNSEIIDTKNKNLEKFKRSFGGNKTIYVSFKHFPKSFDWL